MFPAPYVLARMAEYNALAFDEEDFEFGNENDDFYVILRREKGQKNNVVENDEEEEIGLVDSY